jgi:VWFA-related protein
MRWKKCCATVARRGNLQRAFVPAVFVFVFALLIILFTGSAATQETTLHTQTNIVLIPALVKDQHGGIVYGLEAKDFIIEDDGIAQPVRLDETPEGQPISLVVAIQRGRSAYHEFPRMQGLKSMLDPLFGMGTARVALVEFDSEVDLTQSFTSDENLISADLSSLQPGNGGAAILDAIDYSVNLLKKEPEERERVLLLVSETRDHGSILRNKMDAIVAAVGSNNIVVYALTFSPSLSNILDTERGNNKDEMHPSPDLIGPLLMAVQAMRKNVPKTIAELTGGEYELFETRKKFELRMNDFTNHLHSRYLLSIAPKNPHPGLHQLHVQLKDARNKTVLARNSYWAEGSR